jgi:short-chain Z-isoprenyl diphosphate synthase
MRVDMWNLLYQFYEHRLRRQIGGGRLPEHVGLILDGDRRYARNKDFPTLSSLRDRRAEARRRTKCGATTSASPP